MTSCKSGVIRSHRRGPPGEEQPISTAYIPASGPSKATAHWINQDCSEFFGSFCSKIKKLSVSWLSARRAFSKSPQLKSDVLLEFPPAVMRQGQSRWGWGGVGADPLFRRSNSCCQVRPNRSIFVQLSREGIFPRSHPAGHAGPTGVLLQQDAGRLHHTTGQAGQTAECVSLSLERNAGYQLEGNRLALLIGLTQQLIDGVPGNPGGHGAIGQSKHLVLGQPFLLLADLPRSWYSLES